MAFSFLWVSVTCEHLFTVNFNAQMVSSGISIIRLGLQWRVYQHRGNLQYIANAIFNHYIIFTHRFLDSSEALASLCCTRRSEALPLVAACNSRLLSILRWWGGLEKLSSCSHRGGTKCQLTTQRRKERERRALNLSFSLFHSLHMASMSLSLPGLFLYNLFAAYILDLNHL